MENDLSIAIGKRIAELRRSHNETQEYLSELLSVSPKHISHTERGMSSLSISNLILLCQHYNCSLDYILLGENNNSTLSKLPMEIITLLNTGTDKDIERLNRYLQIYVELLNTKQD